MTYLFTTANSGITTADYVSTGATLQMARALRFLTRANRDGNGTRKSGPGVACRGRVSQRENTPPRRRQSTANALTTPPVDPTTHRERPTHGRGGSARHGCRLVPGRLPPQRKAVARGEWPKAR